MTKVFVTGMGLITSLGDSVVENRNSLCSGKSGITSLELFKSKYADSLPFAEIKIATEKLKEILSVDSADLTRTSLLALHACKQAILDSGLDSSQVKSMRTAIVGANTVGGMCLTDELYKDSNSKEKGSPFLASYDAGSVTLFLQKHFGLKGIANTINTACSSSANVIMYGSRLIKNGLADRVIVGGVDSLAKFTINGFNSLHILSKEACRPFDKSRQGLNLGEGAGFLILEKESLVQNRNVYAEVSGYCNANDAFHPSSLSEQGDGPFNAMKGALDLAGISTKDIDYINAHGTATENNDQVESVALLRLFGTVPPFSSTKSNTGHTLGAAGAVEAIFSILSLYHSELYPHLRFTDPIPETKLIPVQEYEKRDMKHVMSNSFGFGGNCTSLVFSKV
ncbi:MAG: beta-ketoacyl-[acyl-carrier-protein] synthase family protein [Bacteroidetes bacterium]|nr:MAG: beta-ketoacyl-[acyl-carrier-protein] synthase family protein [Bacteroidota bacterium]